MSQDQTTIWVKQRAVRKHIKPARLIFVGSVGIIKALGNKNMTKERLYKGFGILLSINVLK